ncbi:MAG: DUF2341 domain-containing protein [Nitrospirae bacterium]|nr:DUF2341 domain-containing protein [Nitrospirota bacterium]
MKRVFVKRYPVLVVMFALLWAATAMAVGGDIVWQRGDVKADIQDAKSSAVDSAGNVIVTGFTNNSGNHDFYTAKFLANGTGTAWTAAFDKSGGEDVPVFVAVDASDNVIVTGYVWNGLNFDVHTVKYNGTNGTVLWQHTFNSSVNGNDYPASVAVDALGNAYVGGYAQGASGSDDMLLLKYGTDGPGLDGNPIWVVTYNGASNSHDRITSVTASSFGVVVTGESRNATNFDALTIKYASDGSFLWERKYIASGDERGTVAGFDASGNVIVGAVSFNGTDKDIYCAKYNGASGAVTWQNTFNNGFDEEPVALHLDASGNAYITGWTFSVTGATDIYTARYNGSTGSTVWSAIYNSNDGNGDSPVAIEVDESGDVFVAGYTFDVVSGDYNFRTIKYAKSSGNLLWSASFDGSAHGDDRPVGLGLSPTGEPILAGWSEGVSAGDLDYYVVKYDPGLLDRPTGLTATTVSTTEIALSWIDNSANEDGFIIERKIGLYGTYAELTPPLGPNVTGFNDTPLAPDTKYYYRIKAFTASLGNSHYSDEASAKTTVIQYLPPTWQHQYNGADNGDDYVNAIAVGPDNNPVAAGFSTSIAGQFDYYTVKLDRVSGALIWDARFDSDQNDLDIATDVGVDTANNVIVSGYSYMYSPGAGQNTNDIYTIAYPASGPPASWSDQYNGPAGDDDRSSSVAVATLGTTSYAITGYGRNVAWNDDIYLLKYQSNGTRIWAAAPYDNGVGGNDYPTSIAYDAAGDIYVGGYVGNGANYDMFIAKYAGSNGSMLWHDVYNGTGNGDDRISVIGIDSSGNIYAGGYMSAASGGKDFALVKYNSSTGARTWTKTYDGISSGDDYVKGLRIDPVDHSIVISGTTQTGAGNNDFHVIRYDSDGNIVWEKTLDRPLNDDLAVTMGMDISGNVCVVGNTNNGTDSDILSVKYHYDGSIIGATLFSGISGGHDEASGVAINSLGEAFIGGYTTNASGNTDFLMFKCAWDHIQVPSPFTASAYYTQVALSWFDNATAEDGYRIERKNGNCASANAWQLIHTASANTTSYTDTGLNISATYCYRIQSFENNGDESRWLESEATTVTPPAPTPISATPASTTLIRLDWTDTVTGEDGFRIERCEGTGCSIFSTLTTVTAGAVTFNDNSVCQGTVYSYRIVAYKTGEWTSAYATVSNVASTAAAVQSVLTATRASEGQINLSWTDANSDESGINVYRCSGVGCTDFSAVYTPVDYINPDLQLAAAWYKLDEAAWNGTAGEVLDSSGNGRNGRAVNGANTAAGGKSGLAGSFDGTNDYLDFGALSALNNPAAASLELWFNRTADQTSATSHGVNNVLAGVSSVSANDILEIGTTGSDVKIFTYSVSGGQLLHTYTNAGIQNNTWYHLVVTYDKNDTNELKLYLNGSLLGQWSNAAGNLASTTSPLTLGGVVESGGVVGMFKGLIDEAVVYNRALTSTEVSSRYNTGAFVKTTWQDTNVEANTTYRYRVTAFKNASCSWETAQSVMAETTTTLVPPSGLTATAANTTTINLSWVDNTGVETGFVVERCSGAGCSDFAQTGTVGANVTTYSDTSVCANTSYSYRVKAVKATAPAWDSNYTLTASATTQNPATPTGLSADRMSEESIRLTWTLTTTDETGFEIDRCSGVGCDFSTSTTMTAASAVNTYTDTQLTPDTTYRYRVRAYKTATCSWSTGYTGTAEAVTTMNPPSGLTATPVNTTRVDLAWTDSTGNETSFAVERCAGVGCSDYAASGAVASGTTAYSDTSACADTSYSYRVKALDEGLSNGLGGCWTRRVPLSVTGFQPNYQMKLTIAYDADMQADFDDVRFYDETAHLELPYWIESKSDGLTASVWVKTGANSTISMYYGNAAAASASSGASVFEFFDNFTGASIDTGKWTEIDPNGSISQNNGLLLDYVDSNWTKALISKQTFARSSDRQFYVKLTSMDSAASDYIMMGWETNQTTDPSYTKLIHGLYWVDSYFNTYEKGGNTGYSTYYTYSRANVDYEVKIELKDTGARYYVKGGSLTNWSLVKETSTYNDSAMRLAFTHSTHKMKIQWAAVMKYTVSAPSVAFGAEESPGCYAFAHTWTGVPSNTATAATPASVSPSGLTATAISESEINLSWADNTSDETGFKVERCLGVGCSDFAEIAALGPNVSSYLNNTLPLSTAYTYRVYAYKTATCTWGPLYSESVSATTLAPPPPTGLSASGVNASTIGLSWTDNTASNTGFAIERCSGSGCVDYAALASVTGNATSYSDANACPDTPYNYRIMGISESFPSVSGMSNGGGGAWSRKSAITVTNFVAGHETKFELAYDPDMQPDFDDIRFFDETALLELPYWIEKKADGTTATIWLKTGANNNISLYYGNPLATASSNGSSTFEFFDDFRGTAINTSKWIEIDPNNSIYQNNGMYFQYANTAWSKALISQQTFTRTANKTVYAKMRTSDSAGVDDHLMIGWELNQTTDPNYTQLVHGLYWGNFNFLVYQKGGSYVSSNYTSYLANTDYEEKVVLKATGAKFYIRGDIYPDWRLIYDSTTYNDSTMRIAFTQYSHGMRVDWIAVKNDVTTEPSVAVGAKQSGALSWQTDYNVSVPADVTTVSPAAPTGVTAVAATETTADLSWIDSMTGETGYRIERKTESCASNTLSFAQVGTVVNEDTFTGGIDTAVWNQAAVLGSTTYSTAPISAEDTSGKITITHNASLGAVELYNQSKGGGAAENNRAELTLANPSIFGTADFDMQVDYSLPNGNQTVTNTIDMARLRVDFPTPAGYANSNRIVVSRKATSTGGTYNGCVMVNDTWYCNASTISTTDVSGKLRIVRSSNVISTYAWTNGAWTLLVTASASIPADAAVQAVQVSNFTRRDEAKTYTTRFDNFKFNGSSGTFKFRDTTLSPFNSYCWRVYPYKPVTCGTWSNFAGSAETGTTVPSPTGLAATSVNTTQACMSWTDTTSSETGFEIERCAGTGCADFATLASTAAGVNTYCDTSAVHSSVYSYRVRAVNGTFPWNSGYSNTLADVATLTPVAPSGLAVAWVSEVQLNLSWTDNPVDETGFSIERGDATCNGFAEIATVAANVSTYSNTGLDFSTTYCYRVRAYKTATNAWNTDYSNTATGETTVTAPASLTTSVMNTTRMDLSWVDNSGSETGFEIERCAGSGCSDFTLLYAAAANATTYSDTSVCQATPYSYRVRAVKSATWQSGYGAQSSATTMTAATPHDLAVVEKIDDALPTKRIDLQWKDENIDETGFKVERCAGDGCSSFAEIANVSSMVNIDGFDTGIDSASWSQAGFLASSSDTTVPIDVTDSSGTSRITVTGGMVQLYTTVTGLSSNWNTSKIYLANPSAIGNADFDMQVSFTLPNGEITVAQSSVYARLYVLFADPDGSGPATADYIYVDRNYTGTAGNYSAYARINSATESQLAATTDMSGKLRITRVAGMLSAYRWNGSAWTLMLTHTQASTAGEPAAVEISQHAQRTAAVTLTARVDDFRLSSSTGHYSDSGLQASTTYCYRIRSYKSASCAWPLLYTGTVCNLTRPDGPSGLAATPINSRMIRLNWIDNASDEDGFMIEVKLWNGRFKQIATVGPNVTTFTDTMSIEPGKEHRYRVRSYRGSDTSQYSSEAAVTAPAYAAGDGTCAP